MREVLYEESANPSNLKMQKAFYTVYSAIMWVSIVLSSLIILIELFVGFDLMPVLTLTFAITFGIVRTKFYYCVDCTFISGTTRIVKVVNYKKRKKMIFFDSSEVVQVGKTTSNSFEKLYNAPGVKRIYATPNKYPEEGFYVYLTQNGQNYLVILECKETYLQHLVSYTGRQVIEKDYK